MANLILTEQYDYLKSDNHISSVASSKSGRWPKHWERTKILYFRLATVFCMRYRLSMDKMIRYSKNLRGGMAPLVPPGYAYESHWLWQPCLVHYNQFD